MEYRVNDLSIVVTILVAWVLTLSIIVGSESKTQEQQWLVYWTRVQQEEERSLARAKERRDVLQGVKRLSLDAKRIVCALRVLVRRCDFRDNEVVCRRSSQLPRWRLEPSWTECQRMLAKGTL